MYENEGVSGTTSKSLDISERLHEAIEARRVAGILSSETAEKMRSRIERKDAADVADKRELRGGQ